ncbi:YARHG domain-containing protein [uncultured Enterovirga sp.]|uniref:YARHG domain-containing protein n=1 Tax=uncultured Enterovirga sp. TaxID=2026352 RepID=UPI0035CB9719
MALDKRLAPDRIAPPEKRNGGNLETLVDLCPRLLALAWSPAAEAACYDVFGCTERDDFRAADLRGGPNCEFLWAMRNQIFKDRGYCFRTARAISYFGNEGCRFDDMAAVPLSRVERANAAVIAQVEREKGCPR